MGTMLRVQENVTKLCKGAGCQILGDESQSRTSHSGSKGEDRLQVHRHRGKTNPWVKRDLKFGLGGVAQPPRPSMTKDERQKIDSEKLRTAVEEARPTAKMEEFFKKAKAIREEHSKH
jgi:hypothetical protein